MKTFSRLVTPLAVAAATLASSASAEQSEAQPAYVQMDTSFGPIVLELDREKAPITVENFLRYSKKGAYDGTVFHRVIPSFMIQGGGFTPDMVQRPTDAPIKNEWKNGLKNVRGSIAMARLGGQADSATSQFFINVVNNDMLDQPRDGAGYAVFGKVVGGMGVVDAIRDVPTGTQGMFGDVPQTTVLIEKASILSAEEATKAAAAADAFADQARSKLEEAKKKITDAATQRLGKDFEAALSLLDSKDIDIADVVKLPSGLWYIDDVVGSGNAPASRASVVKVHYVGWLIDGNEFDSSYKRNQPTSFPLSGVIAGWTEGVGSMRVGGTRYLIIPPNLAYGERGRPGAIPPSAVLVFKVELLDIEKD